MAPTISHRATNPGARTSGCVRARDTRASPSLPERTSHAILFVDTNQAWRRVSSVLLNRRLTGQASAPKMEKISLPSAAVSIDWRRRLQRLSTYGTGRSPFSIRCFRKRYSSSEISAKPGTTGPAHPPSMVWGSNRRQSLQARLRDRPSPPGCAGSQDW